MCHIVQLLSALKITLALDYSHGFLLSIVWPNYCGITVHKYVLRLQTYLLRTCYCTQLSQAAFTKWANELKDHQETLHYNIIKKHSALGSWTKRWMKENG